MARRLYTRFLVARRTLGASAVFVNTPPAATKVTYVIRSFGLVAHASGAKAGLAYYGIPPTGPTMNPAILFVANTLFTTPVTGPVASWIRDVHFPMQASSSLGIIVYAGTWDIWASGWKLQWSTTTTTSASHGP